jgi:hypothetical protein
MTVHFFSECVDEALIQVNARQALCAYQMMVMFAGLNLFKAPLTITDID